MNLNNPAITDLRSKGPFGIFGMASHATGPLAILLEPARAGKKLFGDRATQLTEGGSDMGFFIYHVYVLLCILMHIIPVVPHKAVAEVSKIGNLERLVVVNHGWQSESTDGPPKSGWSCVFWSGCNGCSGHPTWMQYGVVQL